MKLIFPMQGVFLLLNVADCKFTDWKQFLHIVIFLYVS